MNKHIILEISNKLLVWEEKEIKKGKKIFGLRKTSRGEDKRKEISELKKSEVYRYKLFGFCRTK